jgi:hypothetical protein
MYTPTQIIDDLSDRPNIISRQCTEDCLSPLVYNMSHRYTSFLKSNLFESTSERKSFFQDMPRLQSVKMEMLPDVVDSFQTIKLSKEQILSWLQDEFSTESKEKKQQLCQSVWSILKTIPQLISKYHFQSKRHSQANKNHLRQTIADTRENYLFVDWLRLSPYPHAIIDQLEYQFIRYEICSKAVSLLLAHRVFFYVIECVLSLKRCMKIFAPVKRPTQ